MVYQPALIEVADKFCGLEFFLQRFDPLYTIRWITKDPTNLFNALERIPPPAEEE
jgi:hypothetical protein